MKEASARICANVQASPPESLLSVAGSVYADERTAKAGVKSACDGSGAHGVLSSESEALFRCCETCSSMSSSSNMAHDDIPCSTSTYG